MNLWVFLSYLLKGLGGKAKSCVDFPSAWTVIGKKRLTQGSLASVALRFQGSKYLAWSTLKTMEWDYAFVKFLVLLDLLERITLH